MLKKKIIPVFLASVLVISGTAGFSAGIVSENVYASEEVHTQRLSDFADLLDADQEEELETKDRESYELKHDLITSQVRLENAEKEIALKMEQMEKLQKKIEELEKEFGGRLKK